MTFYHLHKVAIINRTTPASLTLAETNVCTLHSSHSAAATPMVNTHHTITVITVINDTRYTDTYYRRMRASSTGVITAQLRRGACRRCSIAAPPLPYDHCTIPGPSTAITINAPSLHTAIAY